jgi:hypothetical protein
VGHALAMTYVAVAAAVFLVCLAVEYLAYELILVRGLRAADVAAKRRALRYWAVFAVGFWAVALAAAVVYAVLAARSQPGSVAWVAPPLAVLLGTALPMQLAASRLIRAGLR